MVLSQLSYCPTVREAGIVLGRVGEGKGGVPGSFNLMVDSHGRGGYSQPYG